MPASVLASLSVLVVSETTVAVPASPLALVATRPPWGSLEMLPGVPRRPRQAVSLDGGASKVILLQPAQEALMAA